MGASEKGLFAYRWRVVMASHINKDLTINISSVKMGAVEYRIDWNTGVSSMHGNGALTLDSFYNSFEEIKA
jgi:hypothetical protein